MAWSSTVPDALDALVTAFTGALSGTPVVDGPAVTSSARQEAVTVGWNGDSDRPSGVEAQLDPSPIAGAQERERYAIHCAILVLNGSTNIAKARSRAYELLALCGQAVMADQSLGGVVSTAAVTAADLSQSQLQDGALATLAFDVECDAFTRL